MKKFILLFASFLIFSSCSKEPELTDDILGGGVIFDPSLYKPEKYLLSHAIPRPTPQQAARPVIIVSHGYTSSTFEWEEFVQHLAGTEDVYFSRILLGGHGRSYEDFKNSSWHDWQSSITTEYDRLTSAGYYNIHLLGSSTSGALFLELLSGSYFEGKPKPRNIFLVDPIVIPSNKTLSLVHLIGPMLGYLETDQTPAEDRVYYRYRPQETLRELQDLLNIVRKELEEGIVLPPGSSMKIYKSIQDPTADPVSAVLIYKGVKTHNGEKPEVEMVSSNLHVYTRLDLRPFTQLDKENQVSTFNDILNSVLQP